MTYDFEKIGKRIKKAREDAGISKVKLANDLDFQQYQTVSKWESGTTNPSLSTMTELCKIFDCELGYLLCEYDCKTREKTDIQKATGITDENAIDKLISLSVQEKRFISSLLLNSHLSQIAESYCQYVDLGKYYDPSHNMGITNFTGTISYEKDGQNRTVPIGEALKYIQFDFMREILNFMDSNKGGLNNG